MPGLSTTEIFQIICGEIASLARVNEYGLLWGGSTNPRTDNDASLKHTEEICKQFIDRKISGVFFAPAELQSGQEEANKHLAESLREAGIPVVLLDRDLLDFPGRSDFDLVGIDNMASGFMVAEHLIKLGCRKIFFVARPFRPPLWTPASPESGKPCTVIASNLLPVGSVTATPLIENSSGAW